MHRSRVGVVLIDHAEAHDAALRFWAAVAGEAPTWSADEPDFSTIDVLDSVTLAVQRTGDGTPARLHLDVETDDVPAEVARVVSVGATLVEDHGEFAVLRDPGGLLFCVVPVQSGDRFEAAARSWGAGSAEPGVPGDR
jgi:hypothetical protein